MSQVVVEDVLEGKTSLLKIYIRCNIRHVFIFCSVQGPLLVCLWIVMSVLLSLPPHSSHSDRYRAAGGILFAASHPVRQSDSAPKTYSAVSVTTYLPLSACPASLFVC